MKACIYNPYLDTLGGGERYTISFAKVLLDNGFSVDIEWKDENIKSKLENRFGLSLKNVNVVDSVKAGDGYDLCFWVSDGSIPLMHARKNILHFQVPFHGIKGKSLINKMKLIRINKIVCNSKFTKEVIDKEYGVRSVVIYPPVDTKSLKSKRKENIILYVGRFSKMMQTKGQEVLVSAFKKYYDGGYKDWKLTLAGGADIGVGDFLGELRVLSAGYPVEIIQSPDFNTLKDLYGKAKIFWSAAGYGEDETKSPEKMEHFGITAVEAMKCGAVPLLYAGGGHKEIVHNDSDGFLWNDKNELITKTIGIVSDKTKLHKMENLAKENADNFSLTRFESDVISYILHNR